MALREVVFQAEEADIAALHARAAKLKVSPSDLLRGFVSDLPDVTPKPTPRDPLALWMRKFRAWLETKRAYNHRSALTTSSLVRQALRETCREGGAAPFRRSRAVLETWAREQPVKAKALTVVRRYLDFLDYATASVKAAEREAQKRAKRDLAQKAAALSRETFVIEEAESDI